MENQTFTVSLSKNPLITMKVIPGHFATSSAHVSHYLNVNDLKTNARMAKDVAKELAIPYLTSTLVDTIVCVEGTQVIGAYLAEELLQDGISIMNSDQEIHVITPEVNVNKELMFPDSKKDIILDKNILLLIDSISSGITLSCALECISYYGGTLIGISTLFSALADQSGQEIHTLFTDDDIEEYQIYTPGQCAMCEQGLKVEAYINSEGYSTIK
ncbi:phosphoribosyltransferase [Anaerosporobacter sp.]|uniref:phosphoribosyltransferase n=1 Tax=Anaerosporobacter sp. TaxID=1872529 RepID=UPI00286EF5B6|nr:phosphoribosyltransferase [Anaerosporobacter sp.]